jgi:hypothetical protein
MRRALSQLCHLRLALLGAFILSGSLLASPGLAPAHAELAGCYSDPVVVLSNGLTLDLSNTINDADTDVRQVSYTIHAPAGTSVVSVTYTSGPLGPKETLEVVADGGMDQYSIASVVTTLTPSISVVASAEAVSTSGTATATEAGWNNQQLLLTISP